MSTNKEFKYKQVRHIPRNQYRHSDLNALLRYFFKYNFDHYCERFILRDKELGAKEIFTDILYVANWLQKHSVDQGIPILPEGLVCFFSAESKEERKINPYFYCEITLDRLGEVFKTRKGEFKVYSVQK